MKVPEEKLGRYPEGTGFLPVLRELAEKNTVWGKETFFIICFLLLTQCKY